MGNVVKTHYRDDKGVYSSVALCRRPNITFATQKAEMVSCKKCLNRLKEREKDE